ncbi:ankyrin repeat domain-containing protein [Actinoplanes derwentensis]|nr:hypothetical protein [Actinoplanes derwentensis]
MISNGPMSLNEWRRIRRYAVPGWMIAACTAARERGDWRAACDAAGVEVLFDDAGLVADLLAGFAPDLLRWHLPRHLRGFTELAPGKQFVLAPGAVVTSSTPVLLVRTLPDDGLTLDRMVLRDLPAGPVFPVPVHLWDAREAHGLPVPVVVPPADGPVPVNEVDLWTRAGWVLTGERPRHGVYLDRHTSGLDPLLVAAELRRVSAQFGVAGWPLYSEWHQTQMLLTATRDQLQLSGYSVGGEAGRAVLMLHPDLQRPPIDRELVRVGHLTPADLHPLVRAVLFPSAPGGPTAAEPAGLLADEMLRVRCRGVWHWVGVSAGRVELPEHTAAEQQREHALAAFGGEMGGCFQAEKAWNGGGGRLPKRLREYRRDLILRLEHGGVRVLTEMLDAGLDPFLRDGAGRTLIHMLRTVGDPGVLPRLLAAGLDIEARDRQGFTPLVEAIDRRWPSRLIIALVDAGADLRASMSASAAVSYLGRAERFADDDLKIAIAYLRKKNR